VGLGGWLEGGYLAGEQLELADQGALAKLAVDAAPGLFPLPVEALFFFPAEFLSMGANLAQDTRWAASGEAGHVCADLGDQP
jgi:hypothetical protein